DVWRVAKGSFVSNLPVSRENGKVRNRRDFATHLGLGEGRLSICGRPLSRKGKRWDRCCAWSDAVICPAFGAAGRDSRRVVWGFVGRVQITRSVLEAQWKALVVPAPSRRLLRHTLLPLALTSSRSWSAYAATAGAL